MTDDRTTPPGEDRHRADVHSDTVPPRVVTARPHKIIYYAAVFAALVLGSTITIGLRARTAENADSFRVIDQIGLVSVGVFAAAIIMASVLRLRIRADERGLQIRNLVGERFFPWDVVERVAFPPGAHWARVVLPGDDTYPVLAVQAMDTYRAVAILKQIRAIHQHHRPPSAPASPHAAEQADRRRQAAVAAAASRPLGRLEKIDRAMAARSKDRSGRH